MKTRILGEHLEYLVGCHLGAYYSWRWSPRRLDVARENPLHIVDVPGKFVKDLLSSKRERGKLMKFLYWDSRGFPSRATYTCGGFLEVGWVGSWWSILEIFLEVFGVEGCGFPLGFLHKWGKGLIETQLFGAPQRRVGSQDPNFGKKSLLSLSMMFLWMILWSISCLEYLCTFLWRLA